ncbi:MAG: hypothetical protein AAGI03_06805 [Pseudomonadota bacterium]
MTVRDLLWPALMTKADAQRYVSRTNKRFDDLHLPAVDVGGARMYRRVDIDTWISSLPPADEKKTEKAYGSEWGECA